MFEQGGSTTGDHTTLVSKEGSDLLSYLQSLDKPALWQMVVGIGADECALPVCKDVSPDVLVKLAQIALQEKAAKEQDTKIEEQAAENRFFVVVNSCLGAAGVIASFIGVAIAVSAKKDAKQTSTAPKRKAKTT